ncbi:hypothetical protein [Nocardioides houyundeii]|uniref:hypothetical protein n=1 Tax=Nocardioides houyundeii TaxID=2045452 RepID=UPI000DF217DA|nr:hypothetical protein [Nocardioides houyundeii]
MSTQQDLTTDSAPRRASEPAPERASQRGPGGRWWALAVCVVTAAYSVVPYLLEPRFYQRGDTAAQFAPTWFRLGELVHEGQWPVWLDPTSWAGGNYVAEGLFGTYNPLNVLVWLGVSLGPDLAVSTLVVKATVMVALALGSYLLAREYQAAPWAAATVAVALPFSGFTLFWDAGSWPSGLMAFAYAPWVWVTLRRTLRGAGNPLLAFVVGVLAVTHGNPYGTLAVVVIGAALVCEAAVSRAWRGLARVLGVGLCIAAFLPLVYLPLLASADLAVRSTGALFENSGKLRPAAADLLGLSSPTLVPPIRAITGPMQVPATYLAWFVLPLLPWLRYRALAGRWREFTGLGLVAGLYLAMALGPSKLWLFRWPLRVVEYFYLAVLVALAVAMSQGLATSHRKARVAGSAALVLMTSYLTWAQDPATLRRTALGAAALLVLTALLLAAHLLVRRNLAVAAVAVAGVGAVLVLQVGVFGENASSRVWHVPSDVAALQDDFADLEGRTMQFADLKPLQKKGRLEALEAAWDDYLPGSMYHPAGVEAVNNYTGMGFLPFTKYFCMEYDGLTQPCGYRNLWRAQGGGMPSMADLMKLETVVVQPRIAKGVQPTPGWVEESRTKDRIVLHREGEPPWPDSELSWASNGVRVRDATTVDALHQRVEVDAEDGGRLVFAMLGWPGWEAELDGRTLPVGHGRTGLLTVTLPPGSVGEVELSYRPPGLTVGVASAAGGTLLALLLGLVPWLGRRRPGGAGYDLRDDRQVDTPASH